MRTRCGVVLVLSVLSSGLGSASAGALSYGKSPGGTCEAETTSLKITAPFVPLSPAAGASFKVGEPVTFTASEAGLTAPPTFSIASSEALLTDPNIGSGVGALQGGSTYAFTSMTATASARTVYWSVTFVTTPNECSTPVSFTTPARALTVLEPPAPTPATVAPPALVTSIEPVSATHAPRVAYRVHCNLSCTVMTSYTAWLIAAHKRPALIRELAVGPEHVSITNPAGGDSLITHQYRGRASRRISSILQHGDRIQLQIKTEATNAGDIATAQRDDAAKASLTGINASVRSRNARSKDHRVS